VAFILFLVINSFYNPSSPPFSKGRRQLIPPFIKGKCEKIGPKSRGWIRVMTAFVKLWRYPCPTEKPIV
jgi:hypothetical protein